MKPSSEIIAIEWESLIIVHRLFELKELFPHWTLSELTYQLEYEGYRRAEDKPFTNEQVKRILDQATFYNSICNDHSMTLSERYTAIRWGDI
jgi:site-specific DNA recombinase